MRLMHDNLQGVWETCMLQCGNGSDPYAFAVHGDAALSEHVHCMGPSCINGVQADC